MDNAVLLDFGSTFTKAAAVDVKNRKILYTTKTASTVSVDAKIALDQLYKEIEQVLGKEFLDSAVKLATSSAAGGLRMIVVGLTKSLSGLAGENAAYGAGAKIIKYYTGALTDEDIKEIEGSPVEIILFCGGYEGGNEDLVLHNAKMLGKSDSRVPVIYAGNSSLQKQVKIKFRFAAREVFIVDNIIPNIGIVNSKPCEEVIRDIFLERIVNMKGLDKVKGAIDRLVMPTPAAILEAGELLSLGTENQKGIGPLMIVDIGGATTDIHSYCLPTPAEDSKMIGIPEPYAKRTVEGDLGMRESSGLVMEDVGYEVAAQDLNMTEEELRKSINRRMDNIKFLPADDPETSKRELEIDHFIARYACRQAVRRHCGILEPIRSTMPPHFREIGKNLTDIRTVIGTGGPIVNDDHPEKILAESIRTPMDEHKRILTPKKADFYIDADYIFYAAGILRTEDEDAALTIMKDSLKKIEH